ncbi:MAG: aspartate-semialdehyde dehydrogenase [Bdellovibrionales bacterium]|nr:aspartate-semialdehyde dehydrogenase [Bdellovibrionales bacterium]
MSPTKLLSIGVVGATGMVGTEFLKILEQRKFPIGDLKLFASESSKGSFLNFRGKKYEIETLRSGCFSGLDLVFFSSGDNISAEWAPKAVQEGAFAVDNSAAFRMNPEVALVVPEVNGHLLEQMSEPTIIANPNCSTIQLVVALNPLKNKFGISHVRVASYQSVSGAGKAAVDELTQQTVAKLNHQEFKNEVFPHPIAFNNIPQIGSFGSDGFCSEEVKIRKETKKILEDQDIKVSAFTVRTPTLNGHSEAVWVTLNAETSKEHIHNALKSGAGIHLIDDPTQSQYPLTAMASGTDPVYVGRVHADPDDKKTWLMWVVSDNIRKGAALNGIQIAEMLFKLSDQ